MLTLHKLDGHEFAPPCLAQLLSPQLVSYHVERDLPHPISAYNAAWWKLRSQFNTLMDLLEGYVVGDTNHRNKPIMDAVEALYSRTANFIDVLENIVPAALLRAKSSRFALRGGLRKELMMPPNKIKHEANDITLCGAQWWSVNVPAFMIFHMRDRSKIANPVFHQKRDAFSFNVELRRLLVKIYRFAAVVGERVAELGFGTVAAREGSSENAALLTRLVGLPHYCWWDERALMPLLEFNGETLRMNDRGGRAQPINRHEARFTALGTFDGYSQTIGFRGRPV